VAKGETIQTVTQDELKNYLLQAFGSDVNVSEKKQSNLEKNK
jgi:hypothetical protein